VVVVRRLVSLGSLVVAFCLLKAVYPWTALGVMVEGVRGLKGESCCFEVAP
jgi:hypothetical protein